MKLNELAFEVGKRGPDEHGRVWLDIGVLIDGEPFGRDFVSDVFAFAKSCQSAGEMDLFTCGCGISMCAGIYEGIRVSHTESTVEWQCPDPLADDQESDAEYPTAWRRFSFDPDRYAEAVEGCLGRLAFLAIVPPAPTDLPVHDWKLEKLLELEVRPFSSRTSEMPRKIVARTVVVDAYADRIIVGGNSYTLPDLYLPAAILRLNLEREALRTFPESAEGLLEYEAYLDASRKFCGALREHIGRETNVRLTYHPPKAYNAYAWEITEYVR